MYLLEMLTRTPHMLLIAQGLSWEEHSSNLKMLQRTNECYMNTEAVSDPLQENKIAQVLS